MVLNPGNAGFESAVRSEIYVDKTELIGFTNKVLGTNQRLMCVSRPRRFGKSMIAKMLAAYYSRGCDSKKLFENTKAAALPSYEKEINQYNVLYLDVQWFRSVAKDKGQAENVVSFMQAEVVKELRIQYGAVLSDTDISLQEALLKVYSGTGERFVIIIDEWDCLFREDKRNEELQEIYINFLRGTFKGIRTEEFVTLAYLKYFIRR